MEQKSHLRSLVILLGIVVCGAICTVFAVTVGEIDLLLAGVIITMIIEGVATVNLRSKWRGLLFHLVWAGLFFCEVFYTRELSIAIDWRFYLLCSVLFVRSVILQPFYLKTISNQKTNDDYD